MVGSFIPDWFDIGLSLLSIGDMDTENCDTFGMKLLKYRAKQKYEDKGKIYTGRMCGGRKNQWPENLNDAQ